MKKILTTLLDQVKRCNHYLERPIWWEQNNQIEAFNYLQNKFPFTDSVREQVYLELNDMTTRPLCPNCSNEIKPKVRIMRGYPKHCSKSCQVIVQQKEQDPIFQKSRTSKAGKATIHLVTQKRK